MSSLYQLYKHKDKNGTGTVVNKTHGSFVRAVRRARPEYPRNRPDHVAEFRDAFIAGESVPPLDVQSYREGREGYRRPPPLLRRH